MIPKPKVYVIRSSNEALDEIPEKEKPQQNLNSLEKILLNYKLKPISNSTTGYNKITQQIYRKSINHGFQFNLMTIGCSGLGKSTFLNTLFHTQFPQNTKSSGVTENVYKLIENDVELKLKLIEVPKFGDKINNSKCWKKIDDYLGKCFMKQMNIESKTNRTTGDRFLDHLVHACLYFIQPKSDKICLKELDLEFLKNIHNKVNIIPLIAKADSMTAGELQINKSNLMAELKLHEINYFKFVMPEDSGWRMESSSIKLQEKRFVQSLIERFPFAIVGGNETMINDKDQTFIRSYPWGKIEVDNLEHSDTSAVRTLLLSTHMQDLINTTHSVVYEEYRTQILMELCANLGLAAENQYHPSLYMEKYYKMLNLSLTKKIDEMESGFQELVRKREIALLKKSKELEEQADIMNNELNLSLYEFDKDFTRFIAVKTEWDCDNIDYHETYGTLRITRNGRCKPISKIKK